jgi:glycosyltransferase involved in cell wall biosynthesis/cellulose synthase/poly-beta-1,6-N-acetylglucosamine synthase-like glycosyltransferase/O-antigen/teichoic acid export membrane protein
MNKLDIIVPVLNEADNLTELASRVEKSVGKLGISYGILIVDDHSTDNTKALVRKLSKKYPITYQLKSGKKGKAYSILEGSDASSAEYVVMIDGDLQYPPEAIPEMLALAEKDNLGVVTANRVKTKTGIFRKIVSSVSRFVIGNLIMGVPCDIQSGLKLFRRDVVKHVRYQDVSPWAFDVNLISVAKQTGWSMGCVDIEFFDRLRGKSKISIVNGTFQILATTLKTRFRNKRFFYTGKGEFLYNSKKFSTHTYLHHKNSAVQTFNFRQMFTLFAVIAIFTLGLLVSTQTTSIVFIGILSAIYFLDLFFGLFLVLKSLHFPPEIRVPQKHIDNLQDRNLPKYTILCPLYKESRVLPKFVENIGKLDWPKEKLEILLLLEEDDTQTIKEAQRLNLPDHFKIVIVPDGNPKTKPKACNYGLTKATGEYIVIYDAEDAPEPLQLKKAYLAFQESKHNVFCLQAKLNYYNPHQNLLTRLFTAEYSLWFDVILPGLQSIETTIPLGGTSNHFRTQDLRDINGWDAFNVTEDADLGIRLFRAGYKTAIFDSVTLEEANSNVKNWIRQRSRWIKGYLQTYLVHTRQPMQFAKDAKAHFFIFQLVSGLRITFMLINPILWAMTIAYFGLYRYIGPQIEALFPPLVFYIAGISAVFGNFLYLYYYMIGAAKRGQWAIIKYIYLIPIYWFLASIGAFVAIYQLFFKPHFWEKTIHGLDLNLTKKEKTGISRFTKFSFGLNLNKDYVSGAFLIAASMIGNVLNFLYNAYLGRKLDLTDFGLISLVGSFVYITSVPLTALSKTITYKSGFLFGKYKTFAKSYWSLVRGKSVKFSIFLAVAWLLLTPILTNIFKSHTILPFIIFVPVWVMGFAASVDRGFLSGNLLFIFVGVASVVEALTKLLFSILFVEMNAHEMVYLATPISMLFSFVISWLYIRKLKAKAVTINLEKDGRFPQKFFISSVANKISSIAFLSLDLIVAKAFLSPENAGRYAILSLAGKMVYMIGSLFTGFITPIVSKSEGEGVSSERSFLKLLGAITGASFLAFLVFGVFGYITAPILFGPNVATIVKYLPLYTFAILMQTVATAIVSYHQVKGRHIFSYLGFVFSLAQIVGMTIIHRGINDIVWAVTIGGGIYLSSMVFLHVNYGKAKTVLTNLSDFLGIFSKRQPISVKNPSGLSRILIFNWRDTRHVWSGGAEVYIHEIAKRLVKKGHKVTVFCGNDGKNPRNEKIDGVQIIRRGGFYTVYLWASLYYIFRLRDYFDVIIDSENGIPFFTPLYSKKKIFLLIHHVHQDLFRIKLRPPFSWIGKYLEKQVMPMVYRNTEVITVSPSSKSDILDHRITDKDPHVIYNGVDLSVYKPAKKSAKPLVLYLGRLTPQKSLDVFIKSAQKIIKQVSKVEFVIAGDGKDKGRLIKLTKKLGLLNRIKFLGKVSEKEKLNLYQRAWVFVNPSLIEGWGITTIEANACGTPVVASNVAGLRDAVKNPHSGVLVPYGDIDEFSKNITALIKNNSRREKMNKDSVEWAKKFSWDKSATQISKLV